MDREHLSPSRPEAGPAAETARRLLTVAQASVTLSISRAKLYQLIGQGQIDTVHIGRSVRITVRALNDFVGRLEDASAA